MPTRRDDYLPEGEVIWLLRDLEPCRSPHYCWWFDGLRLALQHKQWRERVGAKLHGPVEFIVGCEPTEDHVVEYLLFDLDNGHAETCRYCWWFPTREAALAHRKQQCSVRNRARLSQPVRCLRRRVRSED